jgi:hypothetical protein
MPRIQNPSARILLNPTLSILDRLEAADVLNSTADPFNKDAPTVADWGRNGLQSQYLATPIHEMTLHSLQHVRQRKFIASQYYRS